MARTCAAFRLQSQAIKQLEELSASTGESKTVIVEKALGLYHLLLERGMLSRYTVLTADNAITTEQTHEITQNKSNIEALASTSNGTPPAEEHL